MNTNIFNYLKSAIILFWLVPLLGCSAELDDLKKDLLNDARNQVVDFDFRVKDANLSYCINSITGTASPMDVFRIFLQASEHLKNEKFENVFLCFRGENKYVLSGADFTHMGAEYSTQNPMYTIRTFPEKLQLLSGESAFEKRAGGLLYLMGAQMEDFQKMNSTWYLSELIAEIKNEKDAKRPKSFAPDEDVL